MIRCPGQPLAALLLLLALIPPPLRAITETECRADAGVLLEDIERNRQRSHEHYRQVLAQAQSRQQQALLKEQMELIWQEEEQQRGIAEQMLRDCLRHVRELLDKAADQ